LNKLTNKKASRMELAIRKNAEKGIYVEGAAEFNCRQPSDFTRLLQMGDESKKIASTGFEI